MQSTFEVAGPSSRSGWRVLLAYLLLIASAAGIMLAGGLPEPTAVAAVPLQSVPDTFGLREAMPQAPCHPDDRPETDLQGRVPPGDSPASAQPYTCNLELVGQFPSTTFANFEAFEDCAYFGREAAGGGTTVLDVSDPALPVPTTTLMTPAMLDPWESLRVHAGRELLVADSQVSGFLDVYDVSDDCRQPQLLSSQFIDIGAGHEGWFSADGMTYYLSTTGSNGPATVRPVDISDPSAPVVLAEWEFPAQTHGGWTSEDGRRSYICQQTEPPTDMLHIVDTSEVAARVPDPEPTIIASIPLIDNTWCQNAYRLTYDGHPYLFVFGERGGVTDCSRAGDGWASYAYPRFYDLADETNPVHVSDALLEVSLPEHCQDVIGEGTKVTDFGYSVHYCSPDRMYDPTIVACAWFGSGLRVLDIRDPHNPVEIAYFNTGAAESSSLGTITRPVIRSDRGEIWFTTSATGFKVVKFREGVWPFASSSPCPEFPDFFYAQYNEDSTCDTATTAGVGHPAPAGPPALPRDRQRLDGGGAADPIAQAIDTSQRLFRDGEADRVVLATSQTFADALAGAPLAGANAPILLTPGAGPLDDRVRAEIVRVTGGDGVVLTLGGLSAVAESVAADARAAAGDRPCAAPLPTSCRFAGTGREHTSALIADVVVAENPIGAGLALVARGDDPADALTGGAFAAAAGVPLLLTPTNLAHPDVTDWFDAHPGRRAVVLGGPAAIAETTMTSLHAEGWLRVAGDDRTATSVAIAERLWPGLNGHADNGVILVNVRAADAWQTALTSAALSARLGMPQLGVESPPVGLSGSVAGHLATITGPVMAAGDRTLVSDDQIAAASASRSS